MNYTIYILPSAERDCNRLPKEVYHRCQKVFLKLQDEPHLVGSQKLVDQDGFRVCVGDYRILYRIDDSIKRVYIYRVKHRGEVYR